MKRAIVTIGPQFVGKSTFCRRVIAVFPELAYVSRDALVTEVCGTVYLDPYAQSVQPILEKMWRSIGDRFVSADELTIIVDTWNATYGERLHIHRRLREAGADRVDAWFFKTDLDVCAHWSSLRDDLSPRLSYEERTRMLNARPESARRSAERFYLLEHPCLEDAFDRLWVIDPTVALPSDVYAREYVQLSLPFGGLA